MPYVVEITQPDQKPHVAGVHRDKTAAEDQALRLMDDGIEDVEVKPISEADYVKRTGRS